MTRSHKAGLWIIIISAGADLLFDLVPNQGPRVEWFAWTGHDFTPPTAQWDGLLYVSTVIYHACAHISIMGLFVAAYLIPTRGIFMVLAGIEFSDLIDYAITYNQSYTALDKVIPGYSIPVEFSLFKTLAIILFVSREFYKHGHNS